MSSVVSSASAWSLGWRNLWRDARAGELRLLTLAVVLAVTALTAVVFFADRIQGGLSRDATKLLGGDAVVVTDQAPPDAFVLRARSEGLSVSTSLSFPTMARAPEARGGASKLVALKAVQDGYPLRGSLTLTERASDTVGSAATGIPPRGQVWVDEALATAINVNLGDALLLGDARLTVTRFIVNEPDRGAGFLNFAPRVMLNDVDLPATGLVQPASRITWRLAVAGDAAAVKRFVTWADVEAKKPDVRGVRVETLDSGRPEMRQTLARAEKFLRLVALLAALLSAVAVALAARAFANQHLDSAAMLRVLGLSQNRAALAYSVEFISVGLLASAVGVALGYAAHYAFVWLLGGLVGADLPLPGWEGVWMGLALGLTLLMAFGLPPVLQLARVPPLRVLRRDVGALNLSAAAVMGAGVAGFVVLLLAVSRDAKLGLIAVGGFAGAALLFAGASWLALRGLHAWVHEDRAPRWLILATRQLTARPALAVVQVSSLAVGLLALVLLVLLRTDLIASWRQATPANAPNRFVINILPEQGEPFQRALKEAGVADYDWYPMIRGRLVARNGKTITPQDYPEERAQRLIDREFNLSHSATRPPHNPVIAGTWTDNEAGGASVEEGIATTLGLKLGDTLRFDVAGVPVDARITSLRKVDWGGMRANFFVLFPVAQMEGLPSTWLSAFRAPESAEAAAALEKSLLQQMPNLTVVDMSATVRQVQGVLNQVIAAVEALFGFTLAAGLLVLLATIGQTREQRTREFAILRALGARQALLRQVQRTELLGVGALAGFLASVVALVVAWALAKFVFEFTWTPVWWAPVAGAVAGALLAWAAGWWGLREVVTQPVVQTLRQAVD